MQRLLTEDGKLIVSEAAPGLAGVSSLNDTASLTIQKETFSSDPMLRGWLYGSGWSYDSVNQHMQPI